MLGWRRTRTACAFTTGDWLAVCSCCLLDCCCCCWCCSKRENRERDGKKWRGCVCFKQMQFVLWCGFSVTSSNTEQRQEIRRRTCPASRTSTYRPPEHVCVSNQSNSHAANPTQAAGVYAHRQARRPHTRQRQTQTQGAPSRAAVPGRSAVRSRRSSCTTPASSRNPTARRGTPANAL
jgi:hypothetical protein